MDSKKLIAGYEKMLQNVTEFLQAAEETAEVNIEVALQNAKLQMQDIKEYTEEELERIQHYLARDLHFFGDNSVQMEGDLLSWLKFDLELVQARFWELIARAADPTWLVLDNLKERSFYSEYKTGELMGPGVLRCSHCGKELHFNKVSRIPPCAKCKHTVFERTR